MNKQFVISSLNQLPELVATLLPLVHERKNIALVGEIGAGKTTFVKSLCAALGVQGVTTSPTFAIINEYKAKEVDINHIDLYRLTSEEEAIEIGILELLEEECYCFIEWPQLIQNYLPEDVLWIKISVQLSGERLFEVYYEE
jgi:tRNA threonylcarbamoyladenosine biosynthesis protein TsaE